MTRRTDAAILAVTACLALALVAGLVIVDRHDRASVRADPSTTVAATAPTPTAAASVTAPTTPTTPAAPPTVVAPTSDDKAAESMRSTVAAALDSLTAELPSGSVSLATLDTTTGAAYQYGAMSGMRTGSIVKLFILETLEVQTQARGGPSAGEQATARTMIENSDNGAAETLFEAIGGRNALVATTATLGMTNTTPGPGDLWGLTTTCGTDYIALLKNLVSAGGPLNATSQAYILGLMRNVEADQRWGVGVVADPGTTFANKNGWLNVDEDGGLWLTNSVGVLTIGGHQVLMAVLTQHNDDFADGVTLVQSLAKALAPAV